MPALSQRRLELHPFARLSPPTTSCDSPAIAAHEPSEAGRSSRRTCCASSANCCARRRGRCLRPAARPGDARHARIPTITDVKRIAVNGASLPPVSGVAAEARSARAAGGQHAPSLQRGALWYHAVRLGGALGGMILVARRRECGADVPAVEGDGPRSESCEARRLAHGVAPVRGERELENAPPVGASVQASKRMAPS